MLNDKTVIIGCNGQIGSDLTRCFTNNVIALTHADIEITDGSQVATLMRDIRPSVVINTAGFQQTDRCEARPRQCSWYEFTEAIFKLTGTKCRLNRASANASGPDARRPRYSVLDNKALKDAGADLMESWQESLAAYMKSIES